MHYLTKPLVKNCSDGSSCTPFWNKGAFISASTTSLPGMRRFSKNSLYNC